ncbi:hypothetical protein D9M69_596500 [compost metagenome]
MSLTERPTALGSDGSWSASEVRNEPSTAYSPCMAGVWASQVCRSGIFMPLNCWRGIVMASRRERSGLVMA